MYIQKKIWRKSYAIKLIGEKEKKNENIPLMIIIMQSKLNNLLCTHTHTTSYIQTQLQTKCGRMLNTLFEISLWKWERERETKILSKKEKSYTNRIEWSVEVLFVHAILAQTISKLNDFALCFAFETSNFFFPIWGCSVTFNKRLFCRDEMCMEVLSNRITCEWQVYFIFWYSMGKISNMGMALDYIACYHSV